MGPDFKSDPTSDRADSLARENQALRAEVGRLTRERDAWSDEAVKMLRQRNVLLEWARERAGLAHVHDIMVAAGLAAAPIDDPETPDRPRTGAAEGEPPRQDGPETA
jgi:hypothetical protein